MLPALSVVAVGMYFRFNPIRFAVAQSNVISAGDAVSGKVGGLFFLVNYLQVQNSVDSYASYWNLALNIGLLFTVLFVPYIILVVKGFFRNGVLNIWTGLLLVGSFGALVVPFSALQYWHRWMFMLVYPFTFYAVSGLARLRSKFREKRIGISGLLSSKISVVMLLLTFGLGAAYLATPVVMTYAGTSLPTLSGTYRYFSTAPNVPYEDVDGVVQAMGWLNSNMVSTSSVVLQSTFVDLGRLYLDNSHTIVSFENSVSSAVSMAVDRGFSRVYFVWWNVPLGWYGVSVPNSFVDVQDFGRISVYAYEV